MANKFKEGDKVYFGRYNKPNGERYRGIVLALKIGRSSLVVCRVDWGFNGWNEHPAADLEPDLNGLETMLRESFGTEEST